MEVTTLTKSLRSTALANITHNHTVRCIVAATSASLFLLLIALVFCLSVPVARGQSKAAAAAVVSSAATMGQWAAPVNFCPTDPCVVGANAVVLHTGKVLFYYYPAGGKQNSQAVLLDPVTGTVTDVSLPVSRDIFCSGVTILPNGKVMVTGGVVETTTHASHIDNDGLPARCSSILSSQPGRWAMI